MAGADEHAVAAAAAERSGAAADLLGGFLPAVATAVAEGRGLEPAQLDQCFRRGGQAARRGVALRSLIDLHLAAARGIWPHLPGVAAATDPASVTAAGQSLLHVVDDAVGALTEGYQLARRDVVREQEAARRELVDDLLLGGGDVAGLDERAGALGLHLSGPHAVALVTAEQAFRDASVLARDVERAVLGRKGDSDALVASKDGRLVVVFAAPDPAATEQVARRLTTVLGPQPGATGVQLRRDTGIGRWRIGIGQARPGPTGVRTSYEQAREALDIADRIGLDEDVVDAADLRLYRLLLADRAALGELVEGVLAPLDDARGGAEPLLETLAAYAATGGNATATARRLHLSVRAVTYRLDRICALSGYDPTEPDDRLQLQVAVLAARLIGWTGTAD